MRCLLLAIEAAREHHTRDLLLEQKLHVVRLGHAAGRLRAQDGREAALGQPHAHHLGESGKDRVLELGQDEPDEAGSLAAELRRSLVAEDVECREDRLAGRFGHPGLAVEHAAHRRLADANLARNLGQPSCHCRIICKISTTVCGPCAEFGDDGSVAVRRQVRGACCGKCDARRHR